MTTHVVGDGQVAVNYEELGRLGIRQHELHRRVKEGSVDFEKAMTGLQIIIEGFSLKDDLGGVIVLLDQVFDPTKFEGLGKGWQRLPEEELPGRQALKLTDIFLDTHLIHGDGASIIGELRRTRLKADPKKIRLNADWFLFFWNNKQLIPNSWKQVGLVYFDGSTLQNPRGGRCVLYLCWDGGQWNWDCLWLGDDFFADEFSASVAST